MSKLRGDEEKLTKTDKIAWYSDDGVVNLHVSMPWINAFSANYGVQGRRSNVGFIGASVGFSYFYSGNSFVDISAAGIMDHVIPVPVHIDYVGGTTQHMISVHGSVSNNHLFAHKRFSVGYGLSFGHDIWNTINRGRLTDVPEEEVGRESVHRASNSLGFILPLRYYTKRSFYMGLVYRPMIVQFVDGARFRYQHTASFEIGWRIRLAKIRP